MAIEQMQGTDDVQLIPPKGDFVTFRDEDHYREKVKEWGLSAAKKEFWYKERSFQGLVTIKGYESFGLTAEFNTIVIEFEDGSLSCIHPAYLKEMQQSSFGKENMWQDEEKGTKKMEPEAEINEEPAAKGEKAGSDAAPKPKKEPKSKKEKAPKIVLPEDKVHFTAKVKQFAMMYNAFTEENDEVVVLEDVVVHQEPPLELGFAWCSHSKTLKKFELAAGDVLEFDGKAAAKKLPKGKDVSEEFTVDVTVAYKINNPSKIVKQ